MNISDTDRAVLNEIYTSEEYIDRQWRHMVETTCGELLCSGIAYTVVVDPVQREATIEATTFSAVIKRGESGFEVVVGYSRGPDDWKGTQMRLDQPYGDSKADVRVIHEIAKVIAKLEKAAKRRLAARRGRVAREQAKTLAALEGGKP